MKKATALLLVSGTIALLALLVQNDAVEQLLAGSDGLPGILSQVPKAAGALGGIGLVVGGALLAHALIMNEVSMSRPRGPVRNPDGTDDDA